MHRFRIMGLTAPAAAFLLLIAATVAADPCLVVYPSSACVYHYDETEYYTVGPGHPYYDAAYDRGGLVLLELASNEIDGSIYQAPGLCGFEPSTDGNDGYVFVGTDFELIVDGYSNVPTTFVNILVVFDQPVPSGCVPFIFVDGAPVTAGIYPMGDLVVSTPTADGQQYSDVMTLDISWRGCYGLHIWAFSDENYNGVRDGGECFTAFSHDMVVPTESKTWGAIKSIHR
ncbi:MAG: hypothetical protein KAV42_03565 [Candidatus Krumholzibacteria bacterium]|nr:hypothetical protein [Candidatus Krumholzibacteria bacterium]